MTDFLHKYVRVFQMGGRTPALLTMLLNCSEPDFDLSVKAMKPLALMQLITSLQQEMRVEQSHFDSLTKQLTTVQEKNSRQYKAISTDLMSSQARLTVLMNKTMKCYNLQSVKLSASSTPDIRQENDGFRKNVPETNGSPGPMNENIRPAKSVDNCCPPDSGNDPGVKSRVKQRPSIQDLRKMFDAEDELRRTNRALIENVNQSNGSASGSHRGKLKSEGQATDKASFNVNNSNSARIVSVSQPKVTKSSPRYDEKGEIIASSKQTTAEFPSINPSRLKKIGDYMRPLSSAENVSKSSVVMDLKTPQTRFTDMKSTIVRKSPERGNDTINSVDNNQFSKFSSLKEKQGMNSNDDKIQTGNGNLSKPIVDTRSSFDDPAINSELMAALADLKKLRPSTSSPSAKKDELDKGGDKDLKKHRPATSSPSAKKDELDKGGDKDGRVYVSSIKLQSSTQAPSDASQPRKHTPKEINAATEKTTSTKVGAQPPVSHIDEVKVTATRMQADQDGDELVQPRVHMTEWDPVKLLKSLYTVRLMAETEPDLSHEMITMEGFMEKLPMGKKKSTLLKTWKRRYFKTSDGMLHYYESSKGGQPSMSIKLMGGSIESLDSRILGIDDSSGHYLMLRCPTDREFADWKRALESQTLDNSKAIYIRPVLNSPPHQSKRVVIVDIGSCSIRAGILGEKESLPSVFFPTVVAINKTSGARVAGFEAYRPDIRRESDLVFPVRPSNNTDKAKYPVVTIHCCAFELTCAKTPGHGHTEFPHPNLQSFSDPRFNIDVDCLPVIFSKIFADLNIEPSQFSLLLSTPQNFSNAIKEKVIDLLVRLHGVPAVCMVPQALLAIYSYKATSGIIVDVGERLEIMAIADGYVVEGGVTRKAFGSQKACDSLKAALSEGRYHFFTPVEELLTRHVLEQSCYVSGDYGAESQACFHDRQKYEKVVNLSQFDLPPDSYNEVRHAHSTFGACEGFFNTSLWGADFPTLQQLVHHAIQACPMDTRRDMARSIYLSGGGTVAPGFAERLTRELTALVPAGLKIIVHAAPQRYHSAYIGACTLANQKFFEPSCITKDEWLANGAQTLRKWATPH